MNPVAVEIEEPFWFHVEQLRRTIISILLVIAIGFVGCIAAYRPLYTLLTYPIAQMEGSRTIAVETLTTKRMVNRTDKPQRLNLAGNTIQLQPGEETTVTLSEKPSLAVLSPVDGMITTLRVCFWSSLTLTAPFWMLLLLRFVAPALSERDRTLIPQFLFAALFALALGLFVGFTILLPLANRYLYAFNSAIGSNIWTVSHYLSYTVLLLTGSVLASETAAVLLLLVYLDKIGAKTLVRYRQTVIVLFFFGSAVVTPPDIVSQVILALPLTLLYEFAILYAKWRKRS
jgi:sec-independent protein translocase protein TatC